MSEPSNTNRIKIIGCNDLAITSTSDKNLKKYLNNAGVEWWEESTPVKEETFNKVDKSRFNAFDLYGHFKNT